FFFSSSRRHTRFSRDWSSDVCSSDLAATLPARDGAVPREVVVKVLRPGIEAQVAQDIALLRRVAALVDRTHPRADRIRPRDVVRSEERRVGEDGRARYRAGDQAKGTA